MGRELYEMSLNPEFPGDASTISYVKYLWEFYTKYKSVSKWVERNSKSIGDVESSLQLLRNRVTYYSQVDLALDLCRKKMRSDIKYDESVFELRSDRQGFHPVKIAASYPSDIEEIECNSPLSSPQVQGHDVGETAVSLASPLSTHQKHLTDTANTGMNHMINCS